MCGRVSAALPVAEASDLHASVLTAEVYSHFHSVLKRILPPNNAPRLAVALSGGSDSMALTLMVKRFADEYSGQLLALTVDHALRAESSDEAEQVAGWMQRHGIPHRIIRWQHGGSIKGNLQAAARAARYHLLSEACRKEGFSFLLTGHTADDQVETVALRQQRDAGPVGLAGMSASRSLAQGLTLLRPLLAHNRQNLRDYLRACSQHWVEDPTNQDPAFDRIRIRQRLAKHPQEKEALLALARQNGVLRRHMERCVNQWIQDQVTGGAESAGLQPVQFSLPALMALRMPDTAEKSVGAPNTLQYEVLCRLLMHVGGESLRPRYAKVSALFMRMRQEGSGHATLAHCKISWQSGIVTIVEEKPKAGRIVTRKPLVVPPFYPIYLAV